MYAVEVEAGRMEPIPGYVNDWVLARWIGVTIGEMREMPLADVEEARITMAAINQAQDEANRNVSKGKR